LSRDAVDGIRRAIHDNSPSVFDETVGPVIDETAKPVPETVPLRPEDFPPPDPSRPKPPKDPIADADPATSRSFTFATAANKIWEVLLSGKDLPKALTGWQKAYGEIKPHIGQVLDWLKNNWPGDGPGSMPPIPPTIA